MLFLQRSHDGGINCLLFLYCLVSTKSKYFSLNFLYYNLITCSIKKKKATDAL